MKKKILFKTIQRKYFRPAQEVNLLTWDAKEQLRYLNQEFPEEWTVDRLAESFPISHDGVIKILKSRYQPKSLDEVVRHDKRVQQNWLALKAANQNRKQLKSGKESSEGGPIVLRFEELQKEGKMHLLTNAAGIPSLPRPAENQRLLTAKQSSREEKRPDAGVFSAIIDSYYGSKYRHDMIASPTGKSSENQSLVSGHKERNVELLCAMSDLWKNEEVKSHVETQPPPKGHTRSLGGSVVNSSATFAIQNQSQIGPNGKGHDGGFSHEPQPEVRKSLRRHRNLDIMESMVQSKSFRKSVIQAKHHEPDSEISTNLVAAMQKENVQLASAATSEVFKLQQKSPDRHKGEILQDVQYERRVGKGGEETTQPYIYTEGKGYQHPFGKVEDLPENIKVPKPKGSHGPTNTVYRHGKDVYDEDGEFLYRIP